MEVMYLAIMCFSLMQIVESIFTIVPVTQYVYVNDTVTFECATNLTGYTLSFFYGTDVMPTETDLPNGGKRTTFTATSEVNGTNIVCAARMGIMINTSEAAYIYIEGPPDSVSNLTGYQLDSCCMFISWYPPFTLPGLTVQYIISVGTDQQYLNDSITNYTYCPMNPTNKQYLFTITTTNKAGNGSTSNITVGFQSEVVYSNAYRMYNKWTLVYQLSVSESLHQSISHQCSKPVINVASCNVDNSTDCYSTKNTVIDDLTLIVTIELPSCMSFNIQVILEYNNNGQIFEIKNETKISTHNIQNITIESIIIDKVCFELQYINGSTANSTRFQFTATNGESHNYNSSNDSLSYTDCVTLPAGNWTLYAYDEAYEPFCTLKPAVVITDIIITMNENSSSIDRSYSSTSVFTLNLLTTNEYSSISDSTTFINAESSNLPSSSVQSEHTDYTDVIIGIVALFVLMLFVIIASCTIVTLILIKRKRNLTKLNDVNNSHAYVSHELDQTPYNEVHIIENEQIAETEMVQNLAGLKYIDIEPDPNAPPVPPPFDPVRTAYTEIRPDDEIYNKLHHDFSHKLQVQDDNIGIYSRMNQFTEGVYNKSQHNGNDNTKPPRPIATQAQYSAVNVKQATEGQIHVLGQYSLVSVDESMTGINDPISELQVTESVPSQTSTEIPLVEKDLTHKDLSIYVIPYLTEKWREVGLALALTPPQLDDIEENSQGISDVFQLWDDLATRPFTWKTLLNVLRSSIVNEFSLANQLEHTL